MQRVWSQPPCRWRRASSGANVDFNAARSPSTTRPRPEKTGSIGELGGGLDRALRTTLASERASDPWWNQCALGDGAPGHGGVTSASTANRVACEEVVAAIPSASDSSTSPKAWIRGRRRGLYLRSVAKLLYTEHGLDHVQETRLAPRRRSGAMYSRTICAVGAVGRLVPWFPPGFAHRRWYRRDRP